LLEGDANQARQSLILAGVNNSGLVGSGRHGLHPAPTLDTADVATVNPIKGVDIGGRNTRARDEAQGDIAVLKLYQTRDDMGRHVEGVFCNRVVVMIDGIDGESSRSAKSGG
jgi:hypothetical protein